MYLFHPDGRGVQALAARKGKTMKHGTAYIDYCGGRWEAWHNAEGRKWPLGDYSEKADAVQYCKSKQFARVVVCGTKDDNGGIIKL